MSSPLSKWTRLAKGYSLSAIKVNGTRLPLKLSLIRGQAIANVDVIGPSRGWPDRNRFLDLRVYRIRVPGAYMVQ